MNDTNDGSEERIPLKKIERTEFNVQESTTSENDVNNDGNEQTSLNEFKDQNGQLEESTLVVDASTIGASELGDFCGDYVQNLVDKIDGDALLRQQTDSTALKDVLRAIPERLTLKRKVKAELLRRSSLQISCVLNFSQQIQRLSYRQYVRFNIGIAITKVNRVVYDLITRYELWYDSLKTIEGHFGSAIGTYFKFYRFLFLLNLIPLFFSFIFIVIPEIFHNSSNSSSSSDVTRFESMILTHNNNNNNNNSLIKKNVAWSKSDEKINVYDIITGKGYFENSVLFYGYYSNDTFNLGPISYSMPRAYLYATCFSYIVTLIILCIYTTKSYCAYFAESADEHNHRFCLKVFNAWDFSIATEKAAELHKEILHRELKELLDEQKSCVIKSTKFLDIALVLFIRLIVNVIFFITMCFIGWNSFRLLQFTNEAYRNLPVTNLSNTDEIHSYLFTYIIKFIDNPSDRTRTIFYPIYISCCLMLVIRTFLWLIRYEKYTSPCAPLYVSMIRMFIVEVVITYVFFKFWLQLRDYTDQCWETYIGQGFYQLLIVDFLLCTSVTCIYSVIYFGFWNVLEEKFDIYTPPCKSLEFAIANNTFSLIHNQILFWVGYYFSPVLSLIITIFMFITFYIKKYSLLYVYSPPTRTWRTAQMRTFFLVLTFLSLLLIMSVHGFIIFNVQPSKNCGPFKGFDNHTYQEIFSNCQDKGFNIWNVINYIREPGVVFTIFVILCVNMYFLRVRSNAEAELADKIRSILILQGKDKQFLAQSLSEIMTDSSTDNEVPKHNEERIINKQYDDKNCVELQKFELENGSLTLSELIKQYRYNQDNLKENFSVPASFLVEKLRGIPGSPRTAWFTSSEPRRRRANENHKLVTRFITHHKTGLFM